jgi:hypothetical protein
MVICQLGAGMTWGGGDGGGSKSAGSRSGISGSATSSLAMGLLGLTDGSPDMTPQMISSKTANADKK